MLVFRTTSAHSYTVRAAFAISAGLLLACTPPYCLSQEVVVAPSAAPVAVPGGQPAAPPQPGGRPGGRRGGPPTGAQPGGQPDAGKPEDKDKKPDGEKKEEGSDSVKRPDKPPRVPDPREFEVALDADGNVPPFNFIGQPWPDVMQWLAKLSESSLDWQELPKDFLNLMTDRAYPLAEVRNRINQALHARGYTSIQGKKVLSVVKVDKLDPAMVQRAKEEDLFDLPTYDFVKVTFELPEDMEVDKAKDDVKQLLSPHAKVFPLVSTRRLVLMDSVANLLAVSELLNEEKLAQSGRPIPKEFVLEHTRPQQIIDLLYAMVFVDPKSKPAQADPQQMQQQMQMVEQMRQQGRDVSKMMPKSDGPKVSLVINRQRNSIMANAPPKEMKIIEKAIKLLDVPFGGDGTAASLTDAAPIDGQRVMKKYPLTSLDPDNFVQTLSEIGNLSPLAELRPDKKSKTLFALASVADHEKINSLIDQFDGSGRKFKVIQLRTLPADAVAATVYKLMGGQNEEKKDNNRRSYYSWYDWDRNNDDDEETTLKGFGVDADIENNRLLLWATDAEIERVHELLVELGEIPSQKRDERTVRFIEPAAGQSNAALLEKIQSAWSAAGGNKLIIKQPAAAAPPAETKQESASESQEPAAAVGDPSAAIHPRRIAAQYVQLPAASAIENSDAGDAQAAAPDAAPPSEPPPITITIGEDGRWVISSPDTAALDRLNSLIEQLSPPEKRFQVYRLQHMPASHMYWDLKDYFAEDLDDDKSGYVRDWYGFRVPTGGKDAASGLSKRRKLMITYDVPSNSILVANASASQTAEIEQLIAEFDRPAPTDSVEVRETASIKVHFSRPSVIAAAIKEVYRDLLSSRDKEFDRGDQRGNERGSSERVTVISYGGSSSGSGSGSNRPSPLKVSFDGALSLGADDVSGILIVSAQKALFDDIVKMVHELDLEAAPKTTVKVHRLNGSITAEALQKALDEAVGKPWLGSRPEPTGTTANQEGQRGGDRGDRGRDRDRGDRRRDND